MRLVKSLLIFSLSSLVILFIGHTYLEKYALKSDGGLGSVSQAIEALKIKAKYPGIPAAELQKLTARAPGGAAGLLQTLSTVNTLTEPPGVPGADAVDTNEPAQAAGGSAPKPSEVLIRVSDNPEALMQRQSAEVADAETKAIKGQTEAPVQGIKTVSVSQTADGREVVAVLEEQFGNDANIQHIMALNIPDDTRNKILENYRKTGALPALLVKETQKIQQPARGPASDDPYNKKNW